MTVAKESLTRIETNQIVTPREVFDFCKERMVKVHCMWVSKEEVEELGRDKLCERYSQAKTIVGTHGFHYFEPVRGTTKVLTKVVSSDAETFEKETQTKKRRAN